VRDSSRAAYILLKSTVLFNIVGLSAPYVDTSLAA
jgi:hypothetical protein